MGEKPFRAGQIFEWLTNYAKFDDMSNIPQDLRELLKQNYIDKCRQIALLGVKKYDIIKDEKQTIIEQEGMHEIILVLTVSKKVC